MLRRPIGRYDAGAECGGKCAVRAIAVRKCPENRASRDPRDSSIARAWHEKHDACFGGRLDITMPPPATMSAAARGAGGLSRMAPPAESRTFSFFSLLNHHH